MVSIRQRIHKGDTLVEVMFSIAIFALIAVISMGLMNSGVSLSQTSLEIVMARNEIDAQSEALRFIHNSYLSEKELTPGRKQFTKLWDRMITSSAMTPSEDLANSFNNMNSCAEMYGDNVRNNNYFILNTRLIQPERTGFDYSSEGVADYDALVRHIIVSANNSTDGKFAEANLYPRVVYSMWGGDGDSTDTSNLKEDRMYRSINQVEGIWIIAVRGGENSANRNLQPEYYDFYVRTCWNAPGRRVPSTIGTITRLYNPEVVE